MNQTKKPAGNEETEGGKLTNLPTTGFVLLFCEEAGNVVTVLRKKHSYDGGDLS